MGQFKFPGNCLPTPSPKLRLTLISHLGQNIGLGEGYAGSFSETWIEYLYCIWCFYLAASISVWDF